ncbi:uncharacterized protein METZ01_LOCUS242751, partial [marine metagenome]
MKNLVFQFAIRLFVFRFELTHATFCERPNPLKLEAIGENISCRELTQTYSPLQVYIPKLH